MPKRIRVVNRDVLISAPLPSATETYTVISHEFAINTAKRLLSENGFTIVNERYTCNDGARVASGILHLHYGDDPDLGMMFSFSNSYDKSLRFRCAVGGYVKINNTSIISKTSSWGRKHTGTADQETADTIEDQITNAVAYYDQLQSDKEQMKQITLTKRQYAELLGTLFIDIKMISTEQLGMIKKEFEKPSFNYTSDPDSLWSLYNHILLALAKSHPRTWMEQQRLVHFHLMTEFDLTEFDPEEETVEVINEAGDHVGTIQQINHENGVAVEPTLPDYDADAEMQEMKTEAIIEEVMTEDEESEVVIDLETDPKEIIVYPPLTNLDGSKPEPFISDEEEDEVMEEMFTEVPVEEVVDVTNADSEDTVDETFLMTKTDLEEMYPEDKLEEGFLVTIGESDCEIIGEDDDCFILCEISNNEEVINNVVKPESETIRVLPIAPEQLETSPEESVSDESVETFSITDPVELDAGEPTQIGIDFEIGDAEETTSTEVLSDEKIDELMKGIEDNTPVVLSKEEQELHDVISTELDEIYGEVPTFTYELKDDQYNVVLESGEVIVLTQAYIESLQNNV